MNTLNKYKAKDSIDILIFEKGLRIKNLIIDKDLDLIAIILNTGKILECKISNYPKLKAATKDQLNSWQLISGGIGVSWEELNEDLSVKGFIKTSAPNTMLRDLQNNYKKLAV